MTCYVKKIKGRFVEYKEKCFELSKPWLDKTTFPFQIMSDCRICTNPRRNESEIDFNPLLNESVQQKRIQIDYTKYLLTTDEREKQYVESMLLGGQIFDRYGYKMHDENKSQQIKRKWIDWINDDYRVYHCCVWKGSGSEGSFYPRTKYSVAGGELCESSIYVGCFDSIKSVSSSLNYQDVDFMIYNDPYLGRFFVKENEVCDVHTYPWILGHSGKHWEAFDKAKAKQKMYYSGIRIRINVALIGGEIEYVVANSTGSVISETVMLRSLFDLRSYDVRYKMRCEEELNNFSGPDIPTQFNVR